MLAATVYAVFQPHNQIGGKDQVGDEATIIA